MKKRKKFALISLLAVLLIFTGYTVMNAPSKVKKIELKFNNAPKEWRENLSRQILSMVKPGDEISHQLINYLKKTISSYPWVKECNVEYKGKTLKISVWGSSPKFILVFKGKRYLIGSKGFVLEKYTGSNQEKIPVFFYSGKVYPFTLKEEFVKIKPVILEEIRLAKAFLTKARINGEQPKITILDVGIVLVFKKNKLIVYLDNNKNSWKNFENYFSKLKKPEKGFYDFRFQDLLVVGRRKGNA